MRQLRLQTPNLSGPDVSDWQSFLKDQGILQDPADGQFGPKSDKATRQYQRNAGLTVDGVVGRATMTQAVQQGYRSSTGANMFGMDASANCVSFARDIADEGIQFVARCYANSVSKRLTVEEAQTLSDTGLKIVVVYQDFSNDLSRFSADIGRQQAAKALQCAAEVGQPAGSAIYFAVDFDSAEAEVRGPVAEYFQAVNEAFASAGRPYTVGVYGSGLTCRIIHDTGLASFTWLGQSVGFREYASFRKNATLVQLAPSRDLFDEVDIDDDIAQHTDFGAFQLLRAQAATAKSK